MASLQELLSRSVTQNLGLQDIVDRRAREAELEAATLRQVGQIQAQAIRDVAGIEAAAIPTVDPLVTGVQSFVKAGKERDKTEQATRKLLKKARAEENKVKEKKEKKERTEAGINAETRVVEFINRNDIADNLDRIKQETAGLFKKGRVVPSQNEWIQDQIKNVDSFISEIPKRKEIDTSSQKRIITKLDRYRDDLNRALHGKI